MVAAYTSSLATLSPRELVERRIEELLFTSDSITYGPVRAVAVARSKHLRAMLALISGRASGLPVHHAIELAAAIEVVHTFSLVHDDIEDGAQTRRGHPAVHVSAGIPVAINAGDALHALAWRTITALDAAPRPTLEVARLFASTLEKMVVGQARDLVWTRDRRRDITYREYVEMVRGKTGALIGFAAAAPATLAGHRDADHLFKFGEELGVAFQLLDDVAGMRCSAAGLGKPVGPDSNGAASGPRILATKQCDGVERAIELAHHHVEAARNYASGSDVMSFADTMLAGLLETIVSASS